MDASRLIVFVCSQDNVAVLRQRICHEVKSVCMRKKIFPGRETHSSSETNTSGAPELLDENTKTKQTTAKIKSIRVI